MYESTARVLLAERLPRDMAVVVLEAPDIASEARPGQFVMVRCDGFPLRRPFSIHAACEGRLALLFRVTGRGTSWLSAVERGALVDLTGPLGTGYTLPQPDGRVLLIGGGMGIAPLHFLATRLSEPHRATLVHGARCADDLYHIPDALRELLPDLGRVDLIETLVATDDGSVGVRGSALELALPRLEGAAHVYLCGPLGMCVSASRLTEVKGDISAEVNGVQCSLRALERLADAEVSLELRMACGVGACYGCSIGTLDGRRKVCTDGPVFRFGSILWEEVRT